MCDGKCFNLSDYVQPLICIPPFYFEQVAEMTGRRGRLVRKSQAVFSSKGYRRSVCADTKAHDDPVIFEARNIEGGNLDTVNIREKDVRTA